MWIFNGSYSVICVGEGCESCAPHMRMKRTQKYQILALTLLSATLVLVFLVFPSAMRSARIVGMAGEMEADRFLIRGIDHGSPAAVGGLHAQDLVIAIDDRSIPEWRDLYRARLSEYLSQRNSWEGRSVEVSVLRDGESRSAHISARPLSFPELASYFTARLTVIIILISLAVFMLVSNPKDPSALFIAICFSAFICWMGVDRPGWPEFLSPLVQDYTPAEFLARDLTVTFGMQLTLSALIHVMLIFPRSLLPPSTLSKILPAVYVIPSGIMAYSVLHYANESPIDRMTDVYVVRLWLDSALLILAAILIVVNARGPQTRIQQEQTRWLTRAVIAFTVIHIGLWNLPKIFTGVPLVPSYNWMLLFLLLIPAGLTVSITNHRIFGIRGLVGRRLLLLRTMVQREKAAVGRRDSVIRSLTEEIQQIRDELRQYAAAEESPEAGPATTDRLEKLERDYTPIREARKSSLLGRSPLWEKVFENAVLAARGNMPVLIVGESGTGKTQLARTISELSGRPDGKYREISCSQFEHADPAFALGRMFGIGPGSGLPNVPRAGQPGILEECDGGTLFLDDSDRLPLSAQDLLLFPLEGKAFEPGVGTGPSKTVSLKFILATNQNPEELVKEGKLRGDVLARMGARVHIPPLRDRPEDIPLLVEHLIGLLGEEFDHRIESISAKAMNILRANQYRKGNVRELHAELRAAIGKASLENDLVLRAGYLSDSLREGADGMDLTSEEREPRRVPAEAKRPSEASRSESAPGHDGAVELAVLRKHAFDITASEDELGLSHKSKTLSNHLRGMCIQALLDNDWDLEKAAYSLAATNDKRIIAAIQRKMDRYLRGIRERVAGGTEKRLFNNLPTTYHNALSEAIRRATTKA